MAVLPSSLVLSCFLLLYELKLLTGTITVPDAPSCILYGNPPKMFMAFTIPTPTPGMAPVIYHGLFCHWCKDALYCRKPPTAYTTVCAGNQTTDGSNAVKCNMTGIVRYLYPSLTNNIGGQKDKVKGWRLCLRVSATSGNITKYSDKECCSVLSQTKCTKLQNFKVLAKVKGQLMVTWDSPSDMGSASYFLKYKIHYSAPGDKENKTIYTLSSSDGPHNSVNLTHLPPYTRFRVLGACSVVAHMHDRTTGELVEATATTLEEAPSAPPKIVGYDEQHEDNDRRTVILTWKHPEAHELNGRIRHSLVRYWKVEGNNQTYNPREAKSVIIVGVTNQTRIQGLERSSEYLVTVETCTSEGCGPSSNAYSIKQHQELRTPSPSRTHGPWVLPLFVVIAVVLFICIVIISICLACKRARIISARRKNRTPLPKDVFPPIPNKEGDGCENDLAAQPILEEEENEYNEVRV